MTGIAARVLRDLNASKRPAGSTPKPIPAISGSKIVHPAQDPGDRLDERRGDVLIDRRVGVRMRASGMFCRIGMPSSRAIWIMRRASAPSPFATTTGNGE
jgi:hypothetical protein